MLKRIGISAAAIYAGQFEEMFKDIEEGGIFSIIFTSPESMLATDRWRRFLLSATFTSNWVCVAFDEAHCIAHWLVFPHSPKFFAVKFADGKLGLNKVAVTAVDCCCLYLYCQCRGRTAVIMRMKLSVFGMLGNICFNNAEFMFSEIMIYCLN